MLFLRSSVPPPSGSSLHILPPGDLPALVYLGIRLLLGENQGRRRGGGELAAHCPCTPPRSPTTSAALPSSLVRRRYYKRVDSASAGKDDSSGFWAIPSLILLPRPPRLVPKGYPLLLPTFTLAPLPPWCTLRHCFDFLFNRSLLGFIRNKKQKKQASIAKG